MSVCQNNKKIISGNFEMVPVRVQLLCFEYTPTATDIKTDHDGDDDGDGHTRSF